MLGSHYILDFLDKKGVTHTFGYPGGAVIPLYDAMYLRNTPHVLARHEQGAIHEAEGYARVCGKPGVVFSTSGPGATNLVTGLANAYLDSTPIFAISGQVVSKSIGRDAFQEADMTGITTPITKYNCLVSNPADLPSALANAWDIMLEGRRGPVLLDVTKDVFLSEIPNTAAVARNVQKFVTMDASHAAKRTFQLLAQSKKPMFLVGGGVEQCPEACAVLAKLCKKLKIPASTTLMGKGAIDEFAPYSLGFTGMHGLPAANIIFRNCDLLIAVGCRFSDRVVGIPEKYALGRTIIHADIDAAEIDKNIAATEGFVTTSLDYLSSMLEQEIDCGWSEWFEYACMLKQKYSQGFEGGDQLVPQQVIIAASQRAGGDSVCVTDVGQNQMFAAQHYKLSNPRSFVTSGGLGTMGFGLPAAIGAGLACDKPVSLFVGDGGLQMTIQELATLKRTNVNVKVFLLDNGCLGMVRQWQELFHDKHYSHTLLEDNPDFSAIANAYGLETITVRQKSDLPAAVDRAYATKGPVFLHCLVDHNENVFPMVPPGKNPDSMVGINNTSFED